MEKSSHLSFYKSLSQLLVGIVAFFFILYIGQEIIPPLIFAIIIAILLNPVVNYLERKGCNRIVAIFIAVFLAFLFIAGILYFVISQASMFSDALPQLKGKVNTMFAEAVNWVSKTFNISAKQINEWIAKQKNESLNKGTAVLSQTISTLSGFLVIVFLLPVYIFLFLFYKPLLLDFIARLSPENKHETVTEVLTETKSLIQSYLIGLLVEAAIVATLNTLLLLILGIDYAFLLGVIGALLNLIPYIGGVVAISLPMTLALATKEPVYALYVLGGYIIVQFIDNNFIVPRIVASKVKINALISIIVVLVGGALWGVQGMFLSLPLIAIVKVIFDRVDPLKPFGFLLGDTMPPIGKSIFKRRKSKAKTE